MDCPHFGSCRKTKEPNCEHGAFLYRCGNLNTKQYYGDALNYVLNYDFSALPFSPRTDWKFYAKRKTDEENGTACNGECARSRVTEAYECRCAYLCSTGKCERAKRVWRGDEFEILYYQLPVSDDYDGKIDLILRKTGTNDIYLTEYKPARMNTPETLLRMICEITTYAQSATEGCVHFFNEVFEPRLPLTKENVHYAVMFNEYGITDGGALKASAQKQEYERRDDRIERLLKAHRISVFSLTHDKKIVLLEENSLRK